MKKLARACLRLTLFALPMAIAACYGMVARYNKEGKVVDKDTHESLSDITVKCVDAQGAVLGTATSYSGNFTLPHDEPCDHLEASDFQTPARYVEQKAIPYAVETISMEKVK